MRIIPALCLSATLAACTTLAIDVDPQAAMLARSVHDEANLFYVSLATSPPPLCDLAHNADGYDRLQQIAGQLQARIAEAHGSPALDRAAKALTSALADARESHRLASANAEDPAGPCLAPAALALNRDAIARASAAIAASQSGEGGR